MRATSSTLENNRIKLTVEVDESEMNEAMEAAAKSLSKQVSIKGFRKGKVPKNVLIAHLGGIEALRAEAIRDSMPDFYAHAVSDTLTDPIGQPDINITDGEESGPLKFEAEVEVRPEASIKGHRDLRVEIPSPNVTDEEVLKQIDRFREPDAELRDVDRPIALNDLVTMDVRMQKINSEDEPFEMSDYMYTVGSGVITEGVDELIVGLKAGEDLKLNGSFAGTKDTATYELKLKQVKERVMPELNDAWVEENTEWKTVDEMREQIISQMRRMKVVEAQMSQRDAVLIALSDLVSEELAPDLLISSETNERLHDLGHRLSQQNLDLEKFLQITNQSPDDLLATLRADAVRAVRIDLALRALVKAEKIEPTEAEIEEELISTAEAMSTKPEILRQNLRDSGRVVTFQAEVAKMKASRWLNDNVTFVDPDGVEIDRELLKVDQSQDLDA